MEKFDLAIAYTWEYDEDFVSLIETALQSAGLTTFLIKEHNVFEITELVRKRALTFNCYLDRASDVNSNFDELANIFTRRHVRIFNPYKLVHHAIDKASMHLEFITAGLNTPYSIIIPPFTQKKEIYISVDDLAILNRPFIIKPCNTTGGGIGVVTGAESLKEVLHHRTHHDSDKYILQEKVYPQIIEGKRTWFRCFWAFGRSIPTWWDDQTHLYSELSIDEIARLKLKDLFSITRKIAKLTQLDFFSTEIVLSTKNKFIIVDYVNDQCDMRIQSKHYDGVPDNVINQIIYYLLKAVNNVKREM